MSAQLKPDDRREWTLWYRLEPTGAVYDHLQFGYDPTAEQPTAMNAEYRKRWSAIRWEGRKAVMVRGRMVEIP